MDLLRKGKRVGRWKVAVGTPANPTPTGRFAVSEVVRQRNPKGFFGTYIITISAHSENLSEFDGGDGRVALHGTNRASLLGQAVSHGCVRLDNRVATRLGRSVPPGAPVDILA
jgi:lipoprotein-anchoring transpeptidase ErfK/SrfK